MIYHYTDLYAAKSITENAEVWLTDYRYLNDKEEFLKGHEVLLDALVEYQDDKGKYPKDFIDDIANAVAFIRKNSFQELGRNNIFVSSFREGANKQVISSQADSLIKISRIWADFFPANTSNQPI
ncbi:TPA: hypothetical protein ACXPD2_005573 [Klebsiella pneumoniae]